MPKRNSPNDIKDIDDLNRLNQIIIDKRNTKRASEKKTRRDRHYEKQFIKNTIQNKFFNAPTMNKTEQLNKLKTIVKPYCNNQDGFNDLNESSDFINDLKINSANIVDIILDIEDQFDIVIDQESMERMLDIKTTLAIIETKLAEKA